MVYLAEKQKKLDAAVADAAAIAESRLVNPAPPASQPVRQSQLRAVPDSAPRQHANGTRAQHEDLAGARLAVPRLEFFANCFKILRKICLNSSRIADSCDGAGCARRVRTPSASVGLLYVTCDV